MKKMLAILMALLMAALLLPAYAEEGDVAEIAEIAGTVLEIGEESILLETPEGQLIEAILTADTIREGKEIAVGDFIHVMYNGQMTRSYPAQVTAQHIGCYVLTGTVSDINDEGFTLTTDETTYIVHATAEQLAQITDGAEINVYFSGVIAMSLPGQISAEQITAAEVVEAYITMETADGQQIQVNLTSLTQLPEGIPDLGETVRVTYNGQMTRSIPAQVTADTVDIAVTIDELAGEIVEITGDGILLQTKDMQVLVNVDEGTAYETDGELAVGDYIHVLYDGIMTRSLPAQVYAQKIGCYKTTGTVSELTESGFLLTTETDVVQVNADAALLDGMKNGMTVTVYSNGAMTMSLPGQISAEKIVKAE